MEPGTEIYLGIEDSSHASFVDEFECKLARIIWRKMLKKSFYNYGYGVKFISADNTNEQKCGNQKRVLTQENTQENNIPNRYFMLLITKFWKVGLKI